MDEMNKKIAKELLFRVTSMMEEYGISVFLADGTCLGAYRDGDFIEWHHDVDINARAEEFIPLMKILQVEFEKEGYDVRLLWLKSKNNGKPLCHGFVMRSKGFVMDIHGLYLIGGKRWRLGNRYTHAYPGKWFDKPEQIRFLGRSFYMPTPVEAYFTCLYGDDYMTPIKINPGKELEGYRDKKIFDRIEPEDILRYEMLEAF
jgi:hypothetical protein